MKGKIIITAKFNNSQWDGKSDSEILSDVKSADDECFSTESVVVIRSQPLLFRIHNFSETAHQIIKCDELGNFMGSGPMVIGSEVDAESLRLVLEQRWNNRRDTMEA